MNNQNKTAAPSMRHWVVTSSHPLAAVVRGVRRDVHGFTLPAPRVLVLPYLWLFLACRSVIFFIRRTLIAEPLFKAYCTQVGKGVTTGIYVPWVQGKGDLLVGNHVRISGKLSVNFAARFVKRPCLEIGDHTDIAHDCRLVVGKSVKIGRHVEIAGAVTIRDSGGHPADPARRAAGEPPDEADVKPIIVHDNVWIGSHVLVLPGSDIGEGSIVSAHSVVSGVITPYTVVAGNPARRIGTLTPPPDRAHLASTAKPSPIAKPDIAAG
ncbi:MAG: acyltransferase [Pseudoxanthomonas sp.]